MAVFGFNLTLSLVGVFFLRKLIPVFDLPSRFLTGFYRFYAPSERDCREAANKPEKIIKDKKKKNVEQKEFIIPKVLLWKFSRIEVLEKMGCILINISN